MTIELRDYQAEAIRRVRAEMRTHRRTILVLPTGAGKTRVGAAVVESALLRGSRVLWLAHRTELIDQAAATLDGFWLPHGVIAASSSRDVAAAMPCQVASIQTLLARAHRPPAELIVWDEAHHCAEVAECWSSLLEAYPGVPLLGLTATPERGDGSGLSPLFTGLVVGRTIRQLQADGYLVPCEVSRPQRRLKPLELAQSPVDAYAAEAGGRQALLFCRRVDEAQGYAAELSDRGHRAVCVHAGTAPAVRAATLAAFREGTIRVLCNVYVFTEGTDLPGAEVCVLARGAGSAGLFLQMVGRVLRPAPGKASALLIDLRGITHDPVIGLPDDDRIYSLEGRGIRPAAASLCAVCQAPLEGGGYPCPRCGYEPAALPPGEQLITGDALERVPARKFGQLALESADEQRETLHRWVRAALERGWKPTSVHYRWRQVYGEPLDSYRLAEAVREVQRAE